MYIYNLKKSSNSSCSGRNVLILAARYAQKMVSQFETVIRKHSTLFSMWSNSLSRSDLQFFLNPSCMYQSPIEIQNVPEILSNFIVHTLQKYGQDFGDILHLVPYLPWVAAGTVIDIHFPNGNYQNKTIVRAGHGTYTRW